MNDQRPIGPEEVDRFFSRQRRQIQARLEGEQIEASPSVPSRRWMRPALAAAATVVLLALAVFWTGDPVPTDLDPSVDIVETTRGQELPPTLVVYGPWPDEVVTAADVESVGSLGWLLETGDDIGAFETYPEYLEAFGVWAEAEPSAARGGSV